MRRAAFSHSYIQILVRIVVAAVLAGLMSGCAATTPPHLEASNASTDSLSLAPESVVRNGRYTLVELVPESAQDDLMQQLVDVAFPPAMIQNVGDALRYLLLRSGYRLSDECEAARAFESLPLPAAHAHLGPLTLARAIQVLVGPSWNLQRDETSRRICFVRIETSASSASTCVSTGANHE